MPNLRLYISVLLCFLTSMTVSGLSMLEVTFVAFGSSAPFGPASLSRSTPLYQLAVADLNRSSINGIRFTYAQVPARTCLASADSSDHILAKWYYQMARLDRILVFISPGMELGCWTNDASVFTLTGNWNSLSINSMAGMEINRGLLPTTLSLSSICVPTYVTLCLNLIDHYGWVNVFVLLDRTAASLVYSLVSNGFVEKLQSLGRYTVTFRQMSSTVNTTFVPELSEFRAVSRGTTLKITVKRTGQLNPIQISFPIKQIAAQRMNMTDGQYVYIAMEVIFYPLYYGILSWRRDDVEDETARKAYSSLLVLQPVDLYPPLTERSLNLEKRFRELSLATFNVTYAKGDPVMQFLTNTYDAVKVAGEKVQNLTGNANTHQALDGRWLADAIVNQTFVTDFGTFHMDVNGTRIENLVVMHFDAQTDERQPLLMQYADAVDRLSQVRPMRNWPGPENQWPPPNMPVCGYLDKDGRNCVISALSDAWTAGIAVMMISTGAVFYLLWRRKLNSDRETCLNLYLRLDPTDLLPAHFPPPFTTTGYPLARPKIKE